jgi:S-layer homology domain
VSDDAAGTSFLVLSVSNGATYASGWKNWITDATLDGTTRTFNFADFPQLGLDDKAVYISSLMFNFLNTPQYSKIRIFKKSDLYNPAATAMPFQDIAHLMNQDGTVTTIQPAHMRGRVGVGPPGALLASASGLAGADYLMLWRINDPTGTPTATQTTIHGLIPYAFPKSAPQLGTTTLLDTGTSDVLKAVYREGMLFAAQNAGFSDEPTTTAYSVINVMKNQIALFYRWRYGNFFYPAFDVPATVGPGAVLPNQLTTATTTDASGVLTYAGINGVKQGEDTYTPMGAGLARYGEFFGGAIDPVDGGMWISGEYVKQRAMVPNVTGLVSQYGTWVAYYPSNSLTQFDDVPPGSTFFNFVNVMGQWGITTGCAPRTYCPTASTTRGQMAVFIVRSLYADSFQYPQTPYFTDVPATHPYFAYVQKLRQLGITQGCSPTTYCPDQPVTRSQMAVFVIRAKLGPLSGENFSYPAAAYFTDVPTTDLRFSYVQKMRELGITQGCGISSYCPDQPVTREQMAAFLVRAFLN